MSVTWHSAQLLGNDSLILIPVSLDLEHKRIGRSFELVSLKDTTPSGVECVGFCQGDECKEPKEIGA